MDSNRNWPTWAALALAGLALFVALSGRMDFRDQMPTEAQSVIVTLKPQADNPKAVPAVPDEKAQIEERLNAEMRALREQLRQEFGDIAPIPDMPSFKVQPLEPPQPPQPATGRWRGWFSEEHFIPAFGAPWRWIPGLLQLAGLAAILWLVFRAIRRRSPPPVRTRDTGRLAGDGGE